MALRFDIRTKAAVFLCVSIGVFAAGSIVFEVFAVLLVALLQLLSGRGANGKRVVSPGFIITYFFLLAAQIYILPELPHALSVSLNIPVVQIRKIFPMAMALLWIFRTTTASETIATMTKMGLPKALTVTFAVTMRYFPSIVEEWTAVREAMKIRSISIMKGNPLTRVARKIECHLVPMLAAASRTSDELASAAACRGIDNPAKATCLAYRPCGVIDNMLIIASALFLASAFVTGNIL